jgi:hypothetical protein
VLLVTINEKGHRYFYANAIKKLTKMFFQYRRKFIVFIIKIFVDPLKLNCYYNNNITKEPIKYIGKIDSSCYFLLRDP